MAIHGIISLYRQRSSMTSSTNPSRVIRLIDKIAALYSAIYFKKDNHSNFCIVLHINHFKNNHRQNLNHCRNDPKSFRSTLHFQANSYIFLSSFSIPFLHRSFPQSPAFSVNGINTGIMAWATEYVPTDSASATSKVETIYSSCWQSPRTEALGMLKLRIIDGSRQRAASQKVSRLITNNSETFQQTCISIVHIISHFSLSLTGLIFINANWRVIVFLFVSYTVPFITISSKI